MLGNAGKHRELSGQFIPVCLVIAVSFHYWATLLPLSLYLLGSPGIELTAGSRKNQLTSQIFHFAKAVVYIILGFLLVLSSLKLLGKASCSYLEVALTAVLCLARIVLAYAACKQLKRSGAPDVRELGAQIAPLLLVMLIFCLQILALSGYPLTLSMARLTLSVLILKMGFTSCYLGFSTRLLS